MTNNTTDASRAVANLLRSDNSQGDGDALRSLSSRVQAFLATAQTQPARSLETEALDESGPVVELAVVAGVLQEKPLPEDQVDRTSDLLLPTARTQETLKQQRLQEAQAMLNLMEALSVGTPGQDAAVPTEHVMASNDAATSSDDDVVFMAAEDLENEESTDDEEADVSGNGQPTAPAAKRRFIEEMN